MPQAQILVKTKMFGRDYEAGAILTAKEVAKIPVKNRQSLIIQGNIELIGGKKSKKTPLPASIKKTAKAVADAQAAVKSAEDDVAAVREKIENAQKGVQEIIDGRHSFALAAAKGDVQAQGKLNELHKLQYDVELEVGDLREALSQAQAVLESAEAALGDSEFDASVAELKHTAAKRIKAAEKIDELCDQLALAIAAYHSSRDPIAGIVGASNVYALELAWPLESRIAGAMGIWVEPVKSETRESLVPLVERVLGDLVERFERQRPCDDVSEGMAKTLMSRDSSLNKEQAFSKVFESNPELRVLHERAQAKKQVRTQ